MLVKELRPGSMLMRRGRPIGLCMQKLCCIECWLPIDIWNYRARLQVQCKGGAAVAFASSSGVLVKCCQESCLLPHLLPPQGAALASASCSAAAAARSASARCWKQGSEKIEKSHWCVPFTEIFSKRRKIGAVWSERCDDYDAVDPVSLLIEEARQALFNANGPCGKSCAKTDRDLRVG